MLQQIISMIITGMLTGYVISGEYKFNKVKASVFGMVFFTVAFLFDSIFWLVTMGLVKNEEDNFINIIGIIISKGILVSGLIFLRVLPREKEECDKDAETNYMDIITIIIAAFLLICTFFCQFVINRENAIVKIIFLLIILVFFAGYLVSAYVYERQQKKIKYEAEATIKKYEADIYLENVENNYQRTRELWHDLKNHINLMKVLLNENKYEELRDYLRVFSEDVDALTLPVKSGNMIVDALLSDKLAKAKKEGVASVTLELCDLTRLELKSDEICGLFGNLLDNAIEANRKATEGKFINIICRKQENSYYIKIENKAHACTADKLQTTKSDKRNQVGHGIGMRSVERIVHGYGGEFIIDNKVDIFTVVVRLPKVTNNPLNITSN